MARITIRVNGDTNDEGSAPEIFNLTLSNPSLGTIVDGAGRGAVPPAGDDYVVPGFSWTADSHGVSYRVLNRAQNRQEVRLFSPAEGASRELVETRDQVRLVQQLEIGGDCFERAPIGELPLKLLQRHDRRR